MRTGENTIRIFKRLCNVQIINGADAIDFFTGEDIIFTQPRKLGSVILFLFFQADVRPTLELLRNAGIKVSTKYSGM